MNAAIARARYRRLARRVLAGVATAAERAAFLLLAGGTVRYR